METDQLITNYESLQWYTYDYFYGISSLRTRLKEIEEWTEIPFAKRDFYGKHQPHKLLCQHETMLNLLVESYNFHQLTLQGNEELVKLITRTPSEMKLECEILGYHPEYLTEEEKINPNQYLAVLKDEETLNEYKQCLDVWLDMNLSESTDESLCCEIFPVANMIKRLTEASWLINYRIGKNSADFVKDQIASFKDTSPVLLEANQISDPYSVLLEFYGGSSLNAYRRDLLHWFKACMTDDQQVEKVSNILFFHQQLTQLIQAAYLIVRHEVLFDDNKLYSTTSISFAEWIRAVDEKHPEIPGTRSRQYEPTILNEEELMHPLKSLKILLTLDHIKEMRYGLNEWQYYGFASGDFLGTTDSKYGFELYDKLLKLIELCFVLVVPQRLNLVQGEEEDD